MSSLSLTAAVISLNEQRHEAFYPVSLFLYASRFISGPVISHLQIGNGIVYTLQKRMDT